MAHILAAIGVIGVVVGIWFVLSCLLGPLVGRRLKNRQPTDSNDNTKNPRGTR
jgi:hypothetical protein